MLSHLASGAGARRAQGWSPASYAHAFAALQKIGYRYIALGGLVSLKTQDILSCLKAVATVRLPETRIHLLGVTRFAHLPTFASLGVWSIDSTSPLRQAFMDDRDNYHTLERNYTAIRVPQVQGNFRLEARIRSGELDYDKTRKAEQLCLRRLEEYDAGRRSLVTVLKALRTYEEIHDPERNRTESARQALEDSPWKKCSCAVCRHLKHHVILFRGAERNRRRGFHNVAVFYQRLRMLTAQSEARPEHLNHHEHSLFHHKIRTPTTPHGHIKDNSILRMLDNSLSDGVLYKLRREDAPDGGIALMSRLLFPFWAAVRDVFAEAWNLPPRQSRLTHGIGILSLGNLMDHIGLPRSPERELLTYYRQRLAPLRPLCAWTRGSWRLKDSRVWEWDDLQNTKQDTALLTNHLQRLYDEAVTSAL